MQTRLVREELQKCWRTEGVNHYEVCHHLTAKYLDMLRDNKVSLNLVQWKQREDGGLIVAWIVLRDI